MAFYLFNLWYLFVVDELWMPLIQAICSLNTLKATAILLM